MRANHLRLQSILVLAIAGSLSAACATERPPKPVTLDPSNPAATEAPRPAVAALAESPPLNPAPGKQPSEEQPPSPAATGEHGHDHGGTAPSDKGKEPAETKPGKQDATVYTCPMHPEVTSDKPGKCPKCGMKLVPKEKN